MTHEQKYKKIVKLARWHTWSGWNHDPKELVHELLYRCYSKDQDILGDDFNISWINTRLKFLCRDLWVMNTTRDRITQESRTYTKTNNRGEDMALLSQIDEEIERRLAKNPSDKRRHVSDPNWYREIYSLHRQGYGPWEISNLLGVHINSINRPLEKMMGWIEHLNPFNYGKSM